MEGTKKMLINRFWPRRTDRHNGVRRQCILAALVAMLVPASAPAGILYVYQHDTPQLHAVMAAHGEFQPADAHPLPDLGGVFWLNPYALTKTGPGIDDQLSISGSLRHAIAPHGEGLNPNIFSYRYFVDLAGQPPSGHQALGWWSTTLSHPPFHYDQYGTTLRIWWALKPGTNFRGLYAYLWMVVAQHNGTFGWLPQQGAFFSDKVIERSDSDALGSAYLLYDPTTGLMDLVIGVYGISRRSVLGAILYKGPRGERGQPVMDLTDAGWQELGDNGLALVAGGLPLTPEALEALNERQAYIQIHTIDFPNGEIRANLTREAKSAPTSYTVSQGWEEGGDLQSLLASDEDALQISSNEGIGRGSLTVSMETTARDFTLSSLSFTLESKGSTPDLTQTTELFDFRANRYEAVDVRTLDVQDTVITVNATDPDRFLEPGTQTLRVRVHVRAPLGTKENWRVWLDQAYWTTNP